MPAQASSPNEGAEDILGQRYIFILVLKHLFLHTICAAVVSLTSLSDLQRVNNVCWYMLILGSRRKGIADMNIIMFTREKEINRALFYLIKFFLNPPLF